METIKQYLPIIASLIGGGFAGAILTNIVSAYRSRRQPVGYRIDIDPILRPKPEGTSLPARITIDHQGAQYVFNNLFIVRIDIANQGNKDYEEFSFGLTLAEKDMAVHVECVGGDRHHSVAPVAPITPASTTKELDFVCRPFNRGDTYTINVFLVTSNEDGPSEPQISSKAPIKFVKIPKLGELVAGVAEIQSLSVYSLSLYLLQRRARALSKR